MNLVVNGEIHDHNGRGTIGELLHECQADPSRTAIMINGDVVLRSQWESVRLSERDHVELLMFAGGG
jgi:thiamine biosynthesis protein ThiS